MILVDANILIYAFDADSPQHVAAYDWLDARFNGTARIALPWSSLLAFLRIVTNPRVMRRPASMVEARAQVRSWLDCPAVWIPTPGERHAEILDSLLAAVNVHGNLVMDAHLAALALEHGLELHSTDSDFARFPGLRWLNPLAAG
ncbi:MAG: type II toxin-antitoxin system VapC family toxin [Alphaproteobacteria bacterium]|nr:type II toxin-antitoxin system VapC family toxin [Alphaproteobacteria bacterium]